MRLKQLNFAINRSGVLLCNNHDKLPKEVNLGMEFDPLSNGERRDPQAYKFFNPVLSCDTCTHYLEDTCYFTRKELDIFRRKRGILWGYLLNRFKCDLCKCPITNYNNIIQYFYLKSTNEKKNFKVCDLCNWKIARNKIKSDYRITLGFTLFAFLVPIIPLVFLVIILFQVMEIFELFVSLLIFIAMISILLFIQGRKVFLIVRNRRILKKYES